MSHHPNRIAIGKKHSEDLTGRKQSNEQILKAKTALLGHKTSEETKRKISIALKERYKNKENHPWYGKSFSESYKQRTLSKLSHTICLNPPNL